MSSFPGADGASPLFQVMRAFFEDDEWHPRPVDDKEALLMGFNGKNGTWRCMAFAYPEQQQAVFFSILDTKVPLDKRRDVTEYLTRANYGLRFGNLEMDLDDGEVRVRASMDVEGGELTPTMVRNIAHCSCALMDRYLPGLMKVAFGETSPKGAIAEIEGPPN